MYTTEQLNFLDIMLCLHIEAKNAHTILEADHILMLAADVLESAEMHNYAACFRAYACLPIGIQSAAFHNKKTADALFDKYLATEWPADFRNAFLGRP